MLKFVCILSHGQASIEKSFSFKNVILEENLTTKSLNAQRIVLDPMISNYSKPLILKLLIIKINSGC